MYKIQSKMPLYANDEKIAVVIVKDEPYTVITANLDSEYLEIDGDKLVYAVLEKFYQDTYLNRAEKEAITKLKELNKQSQELLNQTQMAMFEMVEGQYVLEEKVEELEKLLKGGNDDKKDKKKVEGGKVDDGNVNGN